MFKKLSIVAEENLTVRDLLDLKQSGHSVYRTSHAGNWSTYKLLLSELGLPDCIWDVTCIYNDINNQPRYQILGGQKIHLMNGNDPGCPNFRTKFLTPYHRPANNPETTLSHFHIAPLKKLFGGVVTTQSEALLEYKEFMETVFDIVQKYCPEQFGRYILPCGCMVPLNKCGDVYQARCDHDRVSVNQLNLAESAIKTLEELKRLVLDPVGYTPLGGVLYSFELVVATYYLWSYWKFGDKVVYELSGPDMIGYATKEKFISRVEKVMMVVGAHMPADLCPQKIEAKIIPATFFRFGYPTSLTKAHLVMASHDIVAKIQDMKRKYKIFPNIVDYLDKALIGPLSILENNVKYWDLFHQTNKDVFYSQHDMLAEKSRMKVLDGFLDISFKEMGRLLSILPQIERKLSQKLIVGSETETEDSFQ